YHELTQLADSLVAVRNYNVQVREIGDQVLFLHRLQPGGADRSYGIEVGRLAGLPPVVLARAKELLRLLEAEQIVPRSGRTPTPAATSSSANDQLALFGVMTHPVVQQLKNVDPNEMTPMQALELLARLADEETRAPGGTVHSAAGYFQTPACAADSESLPHQTRFRNSEQHHEGGYSKG